MHSASLRMAARLVQQWAMALGWWSAAIACVLATPSPGEACSCNPRLEAEYVELSDLAFDGTVIDDARREPPKPCTEPTRASVRPGCLEIGVFDRDGCSEIRRQGAIVRLGTDEKRWWWETTDADDGSGVVTRARVCKLATGTYRLEDYGGAPRTFTFDAKVGGSVLLQAPFTFNTWRVRIRVDAQIKGVLPREVYLRSSGGGGGGCGISTGPAPGSRWRFTFVTTFDDGDLGINSCSGSREIDDKTPALPRVPVAKPVVATPTVPPPVVPPSAPAANAPRKSGCQASGDPGLAFVLSVLLARRALRRSRRR